MSETFHDGRLLVRQPEKGFRSGLDAVMLAAAVPARPGEQALELGAGAGTASLCLAARVEGLAITGLEIVPELVALAGENAAANGVADRVRFVAGDLFTLPAGLKRDFDQVFVNPPFHGAGQAPPDADRARALQDSGLLTDWMRLSLQRTVSGGFFTTILRADRLAEALAVLPAAGITVLPLWPKAGIPAKRVILRVQKGSSAPFVLLPGLVLHRPDGQYTAEADGVLRRGEPLALNIPRL